MFCIKFNNNKRTKLIKKIEIINELVNILPISKKGELFYSDYTFQKIPGDSQVEEFVDNSIFSNQATFDDINSDKFFTIKMVLNNNKNLLIEITPGKARTGKPYLPHIELSMEDNEELLFNFFKDKKMEAKLIRILDKYHEDIDEAYFYDPLTTLNCYSDITTRLWQKRNLQKSFSEDLLKNNAAQIEMTDLEINNIKNISYNFTNLLYKPDSVETVNQFIEQNNFEATVSSGSLILYGKDIDKVIKLIQDKLLDYIESIKKRDVFQTEFKKIFSK